jgi:hypothetical protein
LARFHGRALLTTAVSEKEVGKNPRREKKKRKMGCPDSV